MSAINLSKGLEADDETKDSENQRHGNMRYTEDHIIESIQEVAKEVGRNPTKNEYMELSKPDHPSVGTVADRFGSWVSAKEAAGVGGDLTTVNVNVDYFSEVGDDETAYWLGMLTADGAIAQNGNHGGLATVLELHEDDGYLVEQFKEDIDSGHKISTVQSNFAGASTHYRISVTNKEFTQTLIDRGVKMNKSQSQELPDIDPEYRPAFVRGFFDGDGSITLLEHHGEDTGEWRLHNKSKNRLETIWEWIRCWGVKSGNINVDKNGVSDLSISKESDIKRIWRTMYPKGENTYPSMQRKVNKFTELFEVNQ